MTPAQIAEFRALLRAQAAPSSPRRTPLAERFTGRSAVSLQEDVGVLAPPHTPELPTYEATIMGALALKVADPPPLRPPRFGRRADPEGAAPVGERADEPDTLLLLGANPPAAAARAVAWSYETPDVEPQRAPPPPAVPSGPLAGAQGWSRVRPPSAQRRLLARLEAVFLAEAQGLEARRAAAAG